MASFLPSLAACPNRLGFLTVKGGLETERGDLPLPKVGVPLLLEVLGMGNAYSCSQSSVGNGDEKVGLGGTFGLRLGVALGVALGWGVLLFIRVFKVSMGP